MFKWNYDQIWVGIRNGEPERVFLLKIDAVDWALHENDAYISPVFVPAETVIYRVKSIPAVIELEEVDDPGIQYADQYEVDRHAEKHCEGSYRDAWRYFEKEGYDMSRVNSQY